MIALLIPATSLDYGTPGVKSCPFRQTTRYSNETNARCYDSILLYVLTVHCQEICMPIKSGRRRMPGPIWPSV